jgi:hypothetical protein
MSKCKRPQDSRFLESRRALYALALLARLLAHMTTIPVTSVLSLVGVSGFPMPKCNCSRDSRSSKSRLSAMLTAGPHNGASHFSDMLTAGSHLSGFRLRDSKMHKHFVTRIPDIPMTQMPINNFLSGLSPMAPISCHASSSDGRSRFLWDFETCDVPTLSTSGTPISRCRISRLSSDF